LAGASQSLSKRADVGENGRNYSLPPRPSSSTSTNRTHGRQDFVKCEMADTGL